MRGFRRLIGVLMVGLAFLLLGPPSWAIPIVRLDSPTLIEVGQQFDVDVFVDGVTDVDPVLGPDALLRFGTTVGYSFATVSPVSFTIAPPFVDTTPAGGGPVSGMASPGVSGENILIATLTFLAVADGNWSVDVSDQLDRPDLYGLFTTLHPHVSFGASTSGVNVPEPPTLLLIVLGIGGIAGRRLRTGKRACRISTRKATSMNILEFRA
jgi:hypothetical protein